MLVHCKPILVAYKKRKKKDWHGLCQMIEDYRYLKVQTFRRGSQTEKLMVNKSKIKYAHAYIFNI